MYRCSERVTFMIGEYLPDVRTLDREDKRRALSFVQKSNQLISAIDVQGLRTCRKAGRRVTSTPSRRTSVLSGSGSASTRRSLRRPRRICFTSSLSAFVMTISLPHASTASRWGMSSRSLSGLGRSNPTRSRVSTSPPGGDQAYRYSPPLSGERPSPQSRRENHLACRA